MNVHMTVNVDDKSVINSTAILYKDARIIKSTLNHKVVVGDFTRIENSILNDFVKIDRNNLVQNCNIGRMTYTGMFDVIQSASIGSFCSISWGVTIGGGEHDVNRLTTHDFIYNDRYDMDGFCSVPYERYSSKCTIGNDVWIGSNVNVLRDVKIGNGAVIGASSVVTHDIPDYAIVAGNPAKIIRYRFDEDIIEQLLQLEWWNFDLETISNNFSLFASRNIKHTIKELERI